MIDQKHLRSALGYVGYRTPVVLMFLCFYVPIFSLVVFSFWKRSGLWMEPSFTFAAYTQLFTDNFGQLVKSITDGVLIGAIALLAAFPIAYLVTFVASDSRRMVIMATFAIPFFVSPFARVLLLVPILGNNGVINQILLTLGIIREPLTFLIYTDLSVIIGALVSFMPFIVFTGWLSMEMMDREIKLAAEDLGARPLDSVRTVVVPLALPGILVGVLFVMASAMGEAIFPRVLGGTNGISIGLMTQRAFSQLDVPFASAVTVVSLVIYVTALLIMTRYVNLGDLFTSFQED